MRQYLVCLLLWMGPVLATGADPATPEFESLPAHAWMADDR